MALWETVQQWQWREADILWLMLAPLIWWLASFFRQRHQNAEYADVLLWPWVKKEVSLPSLSTSTQANLGLVGTIWQGLQGLVKMILGPGYLLSVAWIALVIALAGPRTSVPAPESSNRSGVDILIAMDTSQSMMVQDVTPNRFLLARSLIESFSNRLEANDRLGLMVYAAQPHLVLPLSFDRALFKHYLKLIRPDMLPTKGSLLKPALVFGVEHLRQTAGRSQVLIVFTNGEPKNFKAQGLPKGWDKVVKSDAKILLVGVGKTSPSRIPDASEPSGALHSFGLLVKSRLEEASLHTLANEIGGSYIKASRNSQFIERLIQDVALKAESRTFQSSSVIWQDHAMPFIWLALVTLLLAFYPLSLLRLKRPVKTLQAVLPMTLVILAWQAPVRHVEAAEFSTGQENQAYQAFKQQEFNRAQQLYDGIETYSGWFGAGSSAYFSEDYEAAVQYFRQAALMGKNVQDRSNALFNLGNTYYRANLVPQAIEAYEQALHYLPNNANTLNNLAMAKQRYKLEKGKKKQKKEEDLKDKGAGSGSKGSDGAFYGGQKPSEKEPGKGIAGDAPDGNKDGKDFVLPSERDETDFTLKQAKPLVLKSTSSAILTQQRNLKRMEKFELDMQQIQDKQSELLIRLFEREEGFQAAQEKHYDVPGVKPW